MNKIVGTVGLLLLLALFVHAAGPATEPTLSSKPVEKDGLQVAVTLAKATFAADEQPKFTVRFKNVSQNPIILSDADFFWAWAIRFEDLTRKGPWKLELRDMAKLQLQQHQRAQKDDTIPPGKTLEVVVDLAEKGLPFEYVWEGIQDKSVAPVAMLSTGQYKLTVDISLGKGGKQGTEYWTGRIKTESVTLTISKESAAKQP